MKITTRIHNKIYSIKQQNEEERKTVKYQLEIFNKIHRKNNKKLNPDKTYYVCWWNQGFSYCGLFPHIIVILLQINYAVKNGMIPVVDMLHVTNTYTDMANINAWEIFFKQPAGIDAVEVYKNKNVEFADGNPATGWIDWLEFDKNWNDAITNSLNNINEYRSFLNKYFVLNDSINDALKKKCESLFKTDKKVLGLKLRGTDYFTTKPSFHPIQPQLEQIIEKTKKIVAEYDYKNIYVSTEDSHLLDGIMEWANSEKITVIFNPDDLRFDNKGEAKAILSSIKESKSDFVVEQKNYLFSILLLQNCESLLSGKTSASRFLPLLIDYKYIYFWELGQFE